MIHIAENEMIFLTRIAGKVLNFLFDTIFNKKKNFKYGFVDMKKYASTKTLWE